MLQSKVFSYSHIIGLAAFITAGFLLLICAINICICFHPSRKGLSMKDRFVYMRNGQYARVWMISRYFRLIYVNFLLFYNQIIKINWKIIKYFFKFNSHENILNK